MLGVFASLLVLAVGVLPQEQSPPVLYKVGAGITAPRPIKSPGPHYSQEGRKKKIEGTVRLGLIVGRDGLPRDIKVEQSLGHGLDEKAIEAIKKWKFQPATKDGQPVAVLINVEVNFKFQ